MEDAVAKLMEDIKKFAKTTDLQKEIEDLKEQIMKKADKTELPPLQA